MCNYVRYCSAVYLPHPRACAISTELNVDFLLHKYCTYVVVSSIFDILICSRLCLVPIYCKYRWQLVCSRLRLLPVDCKYRWPQGFVVLFGRILIFARESSSPLPNCLFARKSSPHCQIVYLLGSLLPIAKLFTFHQRRLGPLQS